MEEFKRYYGKFKQVGSISRVNLSSSNKKQTTNLHWFARQMSLLISIWYQKNFKKHWNKIKHYRGIGDASWQHFMQSFLRDMNEQMQQHRLNVFIQHNKVYLNISDAVMISFLKGAVMSYFTHFTHYSWWSFCSILVYVSLSVLPILLEN